ncbi:MAG: protein SanA [Bacteroidetes bacterium]|nr:protein SanA [Bacteroidota bacterium]
MRRKLLAIAILLLIILSASALIVCNHKVVAAASGKLYSNTDSIPYRRTGILLGTNKYIRNKYENRYYTYRIQAAAALMKSGKISYLIVSGDNGRREYDESTQMREDLIAEGVDSTRIYPDYAGFRTFDSMKRAKEVFGQDSVTVISQSWHNERALYIASQIGISAIAFNARDVSRRAGLRTRMRERLARVKVFVDQLTGKEPRYLGRKIVIG